MKKFLSILAIGLVLATVPACSLLHASKPVVGAVNSFDSDTYLSLVTAKGVIDQTKAELAANSFPASIAGNVKTAVNAAVVSYNIADLTYQEYHADAIKGASTAAQQAAVSDSVRKLNFAVQGVTSAKAVN